MLTMTFLALVSSVTSLVPIISISQKPSVVMDTYWTKGTIGSLGNVTRESLLMMDQLEARKMSLSEPTFLAGTPNLYIGLTTVVYEYRSKIRSYHWESSNCTHLNPSTRDYCEECNRACDATIPVAIINFLTSLPTISTNLKRSTREGDLNCSKFMALLTGIIGTITTLSSVSLFLDGCFRHLPEETSDGRLISYSYGPGLICIVIPQILKPMDVLVNLLTPVGHGEVSLPEQDYDHKLLLLPEADDELSLEL
jgi:fluoride ion exporter CrcB/FEX